jgi:hypothetical protein
MGNIQNCMLLPQTTLEKSVEGTKIFIEEKYCLKKWFDGQGAFNGS